MIQRSGPTGAVGTITSVGFEAVRIIRTIKVIVKIVHSITILSYNPNQKRRHRKNYSLYLNRVFLPGLNAIERRGSIFVLTRVYARQRCLEIACIDGTVIHLKGTL